MQQTETAPSIFTAKGLLFQVAGVCPGEPSAQEQASYKYQHFSWYKIKKEHIIIHNLQVRLWLLNNMVSCWIVHSVHSHSLILALSVGCLSVSDDLKVIQWLFVHVEYLQPSQGQQVRADVNNSIINLLPSTFSPPWLT